MPGEFEKSGPRSPPNRLPKDPVPPDPRPDPVPLPVEPDPAPNTKESCCKTEYKLFFRHVSIY